MKTGLTLPQAGEQATKENIVDTAKKAEREGFDSLWVFERLLYPMKPKIRILERQMVDFPYNIRES